MQEEDQSLGRGQLHHRSLQVHALYVAANAPRLRLGGRIQCESSDGGVFANFRKERGVDLLGSRNFRAGECTQESVGSQLVRQQLIVGHPKGKGINSVAVLVVNLAVTNLGRLARRIQNACSMHRMRETASHGFRLSSASGSIGFQDFSSATIEIES